MRLRLFLCAATTASGLGLQDDQLTSTLEKMMLSSSDPAGTGVESDGVVSSPAVSAADIDVTGATEDQIAGLEPAPEFASNSEAVSSTENAIFGGAAQPQAPDASAALSDSSAPADVPLDQDPLPEEESVGTGADGGYPDVVEQASPPKQQPPAVEQAEEAIFGAALDATPAPLAEPSPVDLSASNIEQQLWPSDGLEWGGRATRGHQQEGQRVTRGAGIGGGRRGVLRKGRDHGPRSVVAAPKVPPIAPADDFDTQALEKLIEAPDAAAAPAGPTVAHTPPRAHLQHLEHGKASTLPPKYAKTLHKAGGAAAGAKRRAAEALPAKQATPPAQLVHAASSTRTQHGHQVKHLNQAGKEEHAAHHGHHQVLTGAAKEEHAAHHAVAKHASHGQRATHDVKQQTSKAPHAAQHGKHARPKLPVIHHSKSPRVEQFSKEVDGRLNEWEKELEVIEHQRVGGKTLAAWTDAPEKIVPTPKDAPHSAPVESKAKPAPTKPSKADAQPGKAAVPHAAVQQRHATVRTKGAQAHSGYSVDEVLARMHRKQHLRAAKHQHAKHHQAKHHHAEEEADDDADADVADEDDGADRNDDDDDADAGAPPDSDDDPAEEDPDADE
mmetsp:Transcript_16567/g.36641  ORF Transcript_16567/g.36641 Transcript_16567/m.36641 type:complete len:612 (-) Transcript_16567:64-1899(-)